MNTYQVKFPSTEADCKKVLAFCRKNEGASHYKNPVLENFKEDFKSNVLTVLSKADYKGSQWRVKQFSRMIPVNGKPKQETIERSVEIFAARNRMSINDARKLLEDNETNFINAIGQALVNS